MGTVVSRRLSKGPLHALQANGPKGESGSALKMEEIGMKQKLENLKTPCTSVDGGLSMPSLDLIIPVARVTSIFSFKEGYSHRLGYSTKSTCSQYIDEVSLAYESKSRIVGLSLILRVLQPLVQWIR